MRIGPFETRDAIKIEELLEKHAVKYEVDADESLLHAGLEEHHEKIRMSTQFAIGGLNLQYIYFSLADEDYTKVAHELERFGISSIHAEDIDEGSCCSS